MKRLTGRTPDLWPAVLLLSTLAVGVTTFGDLQGPVRTLVSLWFLLVCPGMALVRLMHVPGRLMELSLAVALSVALGTIVSSTLVYAHQWSPEVGLGALMAVTVAGVWMARGRPRGAAPAQENLR
jgi:cytochrome c oxidase subunit IV